MWTPALEARSIVPANLVPFGLIFASFMVSMMLGSSLFSYLCKQNYRPETMMSLVLAGGIAAMGIVVMSSSVYICLFCFCFFEGTCGIYFPAMGMLKAEYIPDNTRSTIMNLARVPLNAIVCVTLIYVGSLGQTTVFTLISGWLVLGLLTLTRLRQAPVATGTVSDGP